MEFYNPPALAMHSSTTKKGSIRVTPTTTKKGRKGYKGGKYSRRTRRGGSAIWRTPRFSTLPPTTTSPPRHPFRYPFRHPPPRPPRRGPPPRFPHSPIGIGGTRKRYKGRKGYKGGKYSRRKRGGRK